MTAIGAVNLVYSAWILLKRGAGPATAGGRRTPRRKTVGNRQVNMTVQPMPCQAGRHSGACDVTQCQTTALMFQSAGSGKIPVSPKASWQDNATCTSHACPSARTDRGVSASECPVYCHLPSYSCPTTATSYPASKTPPAGADCAASPTAGWQQHPKALVVFSSGLTSTEQGFSSLCLKQKHVEPSFSECIPARTDHHWQF